MFSEIAVGCIPADTRTLKSVFESERLLRVEKNVVHLGTIENPISGEEMHAPL